MSADETPRPHRPTDDAAATRDVAAFRDAVVAGDVARARQLLTWPHVRDRVDDPLFAFGRSAVHEAATNVPLLEVLLAAGANPDRPSVWANGPFTPLDHATEDTARWLLAHGATLTPHAAARLGWIDDLRALLDADRTGVHARGGDGVQPLHGAKTVAIADLLLAAGAEVDTRCLDHQSTPAQYALADRPDVCRFLLDHDATPDIFMAARLGDLALTDRLCEADPACVAARIGDVGYAPVSPVSIYGWTLGFGLSPHQVAGRYGHHDVQDRLTSKSQARVRFANAVLATDEPAVLAILAEDPSVAAAYSADPHGSLARAIFHGHLEAAALMIRLGFDPAVPGVDGGTALHAACWMGHVPLVERLIAVGGVALDARDPVHGSTPLGWAAFGSVHRRAADGDYAAVIERLVAAGADIRAAGNGQGRSLLAMAEGHPAVQQTLRRLGAA
ncbi:MAG: hypothetical protein ABS36_04510 [Acidobacteria bacterium SCN 69-37]|nr:MAG: hypothetical protein ABS36_04510 [Acidobacteria bacterium SCN 69-37]